MDDHLSTVAALRRRPMAWVLRPAQLEQPVLVTIPRRAAAPQPQLPAPSQELVDWLHERRQHPADRGQDNLPIF